MRPMMRRFGLGVHRWRRSFPKLPRRDDGRYAEKKYPDRKNIAFMPDILLATINARYAHASLALRSLHANLGPLASRAAIHESILGADTAELWRSGSWPGSPVSSGWASRSGKPRRSAALVRLLKAVAPEVVLVLAGPNVSHQPMRVDFSPADYIVAGEGETAFRELCTAITGGQSACGAHDHGGARGCHPAGCALSVLQRP
jgi:hypothetical protein